MSDSFRNLLMRQTQQIAEDIDFKREKMSDMAHNLEDQKHTVDEHRDVERQRIAQLSQDFALNNQALSEHTDTRRLQSNYDDKMARDQITAIANRKRDLSSASMAMQSEYINGMTNMSLMTKAALMDQEIRMNTLDRQNKLEVYRHSEQLAQELKDERDYRKLDLLQNAKMIQVDTDLRRAEYEATDVRRKTELRNNEIQIAKMQQDNLNIAEQEEHRQALYQKREEDRNRRMQELAENTMKTMSHFAQLQIDNRMKTMELDQKIRQQDDDAERKRRQNEMADKKDWAESMLNMKRMSNMQEVTHKQLMAQIDSELEFNKQREKRKTIDHLKSQFEAIDQSQSSATGGDNSFVPGLK